MNTQDRNAEDADAIKDLIGGNPSLKKLLAYAKRLDVPVWALMLPGLQDHPELLAPGALKPLERLIERYLAGSPEARATMEKSETPPRLSTGLTIERLDRLASQAMGIIRVISKRLDAIDNVGDRLSAEEATDWACALNGAESVLGEIAGIADELRRDA